MRPTPAKTRALRIGVVLGDTIIDERTMRAPAAFSIGRSMRNTIAVPSPDLPRSWPLLTMTADGVLVRLGDDMDIRIATGGEVLSRADVAASAEQHRDHIAFVVRHGSHGKIELGEVRVLFQEVLLPAAAPRPTLPRAVRGGLIDRIDRRVAVFAAVSILGHGGLLVAAEANDPPGAGIVERAAQTSYVPETLMVIDAADLAYLDAPKPPVTTPPAASNVPTTPATPDQPTVRPRTTPTSRPPVATPVGTPEDATRYAEELFADSGGGSHSGDLERRKPGSDLGKQLEEVADSNAKTSIGNDEGDRLRDGDKPRTGTAKDPVLAPPTGPVTIGPPKDETKPPRVIPYGPPRVAGGPDVGSIVRKIGTTYLPGLQRCYKKSLGGDATLAGKVALSFTVTDKGTTTDLRASGVGADLESCVEGLMQKWTFTPVVDGDGDATDVDLKMSLQMSPT